MSAALDLLRDKARSLRVLASGEVSRGEAEELAASKHREDAAKYIKEAEEYEAAAEQLLPAAVEAAFKAGFDIKWTAEDEARFQKRRAMLDAEVAP